MEFNQIWRGKFPPYWDVTTWAILAENYVVACYREMDNNHKRVFMVFDLDHGSRFYEEGIFNILLGNLGTNVVLGRITDRRSHVQLNRLTNYDILKQSVQWSVNDSFLVEKYKIPLIPCNSYQLNVGNYMIDLMNGVTTPSTSTNKYSWSLKPEFWLEQHGNLLSCAHKQNGILWTKENMYGKWYQGMQSGALFFLLPENQLMILDMQTGNLLDVIFLENLKRATNRIGGLFEARNERSYESCTMFDVLINEHQVTWINNDNEIKIFNRKSREILCGKYETEMELFLSSISSEFVLIYALENDQYGELVAFKLREGNYAADIN